MSNSREVPLILFAAALAIRLVALWMAGDTRPVLDERLYLIRAQALLDGQGFVGSYQSWVRHPERRLMAALPQYPGAYQPPGYTAFVAGVLGLTGGSVKAVKIVQAVFGSLTVLLVYAIGSAWFDRRIAWVAGWICALYPNLIGFSHFLWSETLYIALLTLAVWLVTRTAGLPRTGQAVSAGVVFGLAALTRGLSLFLVVLVCVWLLAAHREVPREALKCAGTVLAVALAVVAPWSLRNTMLHDGFVFIDTSGPFNLWRGNAPSTFANRPAAAEASYAAPFRSLPLMPVGPQDQRRFIAAVIQDSGIDRPSDLQIVRHGRQLARRLILQAPGTFLKRSWTKLVDLWNPTSFVMRQLRLGAYGDVSPSVEGLLSSVIILTYLLVAGLSLAGIAFSLSERNTWLVLLLVGFTSAASVATFGLTRFRLPVLPFLIVMAAHGATVLVERARRD